MSKFLTKYNFAVKSIAVDESLHIFSQMNENFSETLLRLEKENSVLKPHKRAVNLEIKNIGMKMRLYE